MNKRDSLEMTRKKAQEEMVGFALIMIFVFIILLIFLSFYLRNSGRESVNSYEVGSFMGALTQYTTECETEFGFVTIGSLVKECGKEPSAICKNGISSCTTLNRTLISLIEKSWNVGEDRPIKGYELLITYEDGDETRLLTKLIGGNQSLNSKGDTRLISSAGKDYVINLKIYYE